MTTVPTFTSVIWVGTKGRDSGLIVPPDVIFTAIQQYVDSVGLCVSVTPTTFVYTNGSEPGFAVGLINYPRLPSSPEQIHERAMKLAGILMELGKQFKVTVVDPQTTTMLSSEEN